MAQSAATSGSPTPRDALVQLTHVIYGLHAFSAVSGLVGTATIVGAFLTGWPSIIAVILNYAKRGELEGTYLASHFSWQIRTFWYALAWVVIGVIFAVTLIGIPISLAIFFATGLWVLYRIARGWLALLDRKPMAIPA